MAGPQINNRESVFSAWLLASALIIALLFNGVYLYILSLSWVVLVIWSVYLFSQKKEVQIPIDVTLLVIALFIIWMVVSLYWHPAPWRGNIFNWRFGIYFLVLIVTYLLMRNRDDVSALKALTLVAVGVGLISIFQSSYLGQEALGVFDNKNNNAAFLNLFILPVMSLLLFQEKRSNETGLRSLFYVLLLFAMLQSTSRGAVLGFAVGALMLFAMALSVRKTGNALWIIFLTVLVLLLDAFFSSVELDGGLNAHGRWDIWKSTIAILGDANWYGIGNGMFYFLYPAYQQENVSSGIFVHNDYLQILLELGYPGLLLLMPLIMSIVYQFRMTLHKSKNYNEVSLYSGLFAAITSVAIHSLLTFNLYKTGILLVLGLYSGIILRNGIRHSNFRQYALEVTRSKIVLLVVFSAVTLQSIAIPAYVQAVDYGVVSSALVGDMPENLSQRYRYLAELDPGNYQYPLMAAYTLSRSSMNGEFDKRNDAYKNIRKLIGEAKALNPYNWEAYALEAEVLRNYRDIVGDEWHDEALILASKAVQLNPRLVYPRTTLARIFEDRGDNEKALRVLLDGINPNYSSNIDFYRYGEKLAKESGKLSIAKLFRDARNKYIIEQNSLVE